MSRPFAFCWTLLTLCQLFHVGCQPAERYGPVQPSTPSPATQDGSRPSKEPAIYAWLPPVARKEIPIQFVPSTASDWAKLPGFWSIAPHPVAGPSTAHLGQSPLGAVWALQLADQLALTIRIKVPLGLPEPTFPAANPPTYPKWDLGKR